MRLEAAQGFPTKGQPAIFWLGQAGFWVETGDRSILIDPYLSDSLARKYAGKANPHLRMMPPPVAVAELPRPDLVLVTHAHTDHMDPDTLGPLAARFPDVPFIVPAAAMPTARDRIGATAHLIPVDAGDEIHGVTVFPAAHETREVDEQGRHRFLGYGFNAGGVRIYHSGDCVPFDGLDPLVQSFAPQIALLPVNGRDARRRDAGIPGNFTLDEARQIARNCAFFVPHHFGMFDFNTLDPKEIDAAIASRADGPVIVRPIPGESLRIVT